MQDEVQYRFQSEWYVCGVGMENYYILKKAPLRANGEHCLLGRVICWRNSLPYIYTLLCEKPPHEI